MPVNQVGQKKKFPTWAWWVIGICVVLIVVIIAVLVIRSKSSGSTEGTSTAPVASTGSASTVSGLDMEQVVVVKKNDGLYLVPVSDLTKSAEKVSFGASVAYAADSDIIIDPEGIDMDHVLAAVISPDGKSVYYSVGVDYTEGPAGPDTMPLSSVVYKTDIDTPNQAEKVFATSDENFRDKVGWIVSKIAISAGEPDSLFVGTHSYGSGGAIHKIDLKNLEQTDIGGGNAGINISPNGKMIASTDHDSWVGGGSYDSLYINTLDGQNKNKLTGKDYYIWNIAWLDDNQLIVYANKEEIDENATEEHIGTTDKRFYIIDTSGDIQPLKNIEEIVGTEDYNEAEDLEQFIGRDVDVNDIIPMYGTTQVLLDLNFRINGEDIDRYYIYNYKTGESWRLNELGGEVLSTGEIEQ